jgi:hypothetical protein
VTNVQVINFFTLLLRCNSQRMELSHGGRLAAVCINGNSHIYTSCGQMSALKTINMPYHTTPVSFLQQKTWLKSKAVPNE